MNKMLKGLLVAALAASAAQLSAYTNKTFLMPRPQGVNVPMEYTTFNELASRKIEDSFGGNLAVTGYYQASTNGAQTAKYFLVNEKSRITFAGPATNAINTSPATLPAGADVDVFYLIHNAGQANAGFPTNLTMGLNPELTAWGLRFDYWQNLDKITKGLFLYVNLPVSGVTTNPKLSIGGTDYALTANQFGANTSLQANLRNYFAGTYSVNQSATNAGAAFANPAGNAATNTGGGNVGANNQAALQYSKIGGNRSETGVADIDIALGYKFLNCESYYASLALAITIPTGNTAKGQWLFEPIVGNGNHFGLGGDLDIMGRLWGDCDSSVKFVTKWKYRYLFESSERRTMGIGNAPSTIFSRYVLLVKAAQAAAAGGAGSAPSGQLIPAANVTTQNLNVTPGSQLDGIIGFAFNCGGFSWDLGYNLYYREKEQVRFKDSFADNVYAVANLSFDTSSATPATFAGVQAANANAANAPWDGNNILNVLAQADLDRDSASTPAQLTNSIYTGLGYIFKEWETPLMLGLGGKYEWASKNSALDQWNVYGKIGIGF